MRAVARPGYVVVAALLALGFWNLGQGAYIPAKATEDLAAHWEGSELRWLPGGHATLIWYRKQRLAAIIDETFERTHSTVARPQSSVDD